MKVTPKQKKKGTGGKTLNNPPHKKMLTQPPPEGEKARNNSRYSCGGTVSLGGRVTYAFFCLWVARIWGLTPPRKATSTESCPPAHGELFERSIWREVTAQHCPCCSAN